MKKLFLLFFLITITLFFSTDTIISSYETSNIKGVVISPFDSYFTIMNENKYLKVYDFSKSLKNYLETSGKPNVLAWSSDEKYLFSGNINGTINIFNIKDSTFNFDISLTSQPIISLNINNKNLLFSSLDKSIYVYNIKDRKKIFSFKTIGIPYSVKFIDENNIIVGDSYETLYKINISNNEYKKIKINGYIKNIFYVDNEIHVFLTNGYIFIYDKNLNLINKRNLNLNIEKIFLSPDKNYYAILFSNNDVMIYSSKSFIIINRLTVDNLGFKIKDASWSSEWQYIYVTDGKDIYKINFPYGIRELFYKNLGVLIKRVIWKKNKIIYSDSNSNIGEINIETGIMEKFLSLKPFNYFDINNKYITTVDNSYIYFYSLDGVLLKSKKLSNSKLTVVKINPNSLYAVAGSIDGTGYIYNIDKNTFKTVKLHQKMIKDISFNKDGDFVAATAYDRTVSISDFPNITTTKRINDFNFNIWSIDWANTKNFIAVGGFEGVLEEWDPLFKTIIIKTGISAGSINDIKWSPDDRLIATSSENSNIYIWNSFTGEKVNVLNLNNEQPVKDIDWSNGGKYIISSENSNLMRLWNIDTKENIANILVYADGSFITYKNDGEYTTNIPEKNEKFYFYKNNPLSLFDVFYFKRINKLNLKEVEPPQLNVLSDFIVEKNNSSLLISFSDNNLVKKAQIGNDTFIINKKSYKLNYTINIENLTSDILNIMVFDDNGNKTEKNVHLSFKNIKLKVISKDVYIRNDSGKIIGVLTGSIKNFV
ncbi:hypothetical protein OSSY52_08050 [Tepiditoga spiralis]|uniref:Anaphase-promoting complex subunit 4 WD40 domain-containing protein n=1 Tax=Tepiditoga spiralis TaxID=2108365 RepID=A0A7G1G6C0_9BACT|nr:SdiA-regulated domain-containing protein [Tepiditoga spiralis]BBE30664.1 hypothetical protein OSSY52_08050 [Tepiditoga spiralis]